MPCYSRGMKIYTLFRCFDCQAINAGRFKNNKVVFVFIFLLATGFFPGKGTGRAVEFVPAVYGAELPLDRSKWSFPLRYSITDRTISPGKSKPSPEGYQHKKNTSSVAIKQKIVQPASLMQERRKQRRMLMNSPTCGRPWKSPLTQIHGRIRNVEYRVQPVTGRRGLHLDIETDRQIETIIHVYPERLTAKCPSVFYFMVGDEVTVTGSEFFTGRGGKQQNICAAKITQEDKVLGVRDPVTGDLERQLCCEEICEKNCAGLPFMCDRVCIGNCGEKRLQAVFQNIPFRSSNDEEYASKPLD